MNRHPETNQGNDLRHKAEERLKDCKSNLGDLVAEEGRDALALVHELQVHQVELEMQNEELKRSKLEAEDALAKYSDLYDFAPIGLFTLDAKGLIQEVNLAGAALLGQKRRNLIHRQFRRFVDAKCRSSFDDFCRKAFETCIRQKCELNFSRNGEPSVYASVEGTAAEEGSLNKKQFRIAAIDITERKQSEEKLRETRDYLENLISYANAPIVVWDPSFKITRFNNAFERLTGLSASEALGAPLNILFPENSRDKSLEHIRRTLSGERWDAVEIPILKMDGSIRTVLWNSANIHGSNGSTVIATIAQGQDITDRKLAEEELRRARDELELRVQERTSELQKTNETLQESEERFRKTFDQSPIGAAMVALDYKYLRINPAYCRIMGYSREELSSLTFVILTHPDDLEADLKQARRLAEGVIDRYQMDKRYIRKDGKIIWGHLSVSTVKDASGRPLYFLPMIEDITERKNVEIALREARDAAETAAQAKSDFMANMSHEIRTPMNAVIGMTSLLLGDETLAPEHRDFVETIRTSGDALMVIINDILDFSKMDHEKTILEAQPFDLCCCIEESIDMIAVLAKEKKLNLAYEIDENVPQVVIGDPTRLRQILVNLLNNAVKFTNMGEVKLSVSDQVFSNIHEIHFAIKDTGIGISTEDIEKLFKPFSQVEASTTRNYGGTGLGLAICKKLVELMDGRLWLESELGKGSTFHFTIRTTTASHYAGPLLKIIQPQLVGKHVLIVDGNKTNRRILGLQAYSWGMVPMIASSGEDALSWIKRGDGFDLAIIDESLVDIDGLALAKEMRKIQSALPIVLLASLGHHETFDIYSAVLSKPIKPAQLYAILLELFAKKPGDGSYRADDKGQAFDSSLILLAEDNTSSQKVIMAMLKRLGYRADAVANGIEALQALNRQHYDLVLMDIRMPEMGGLDTTKIIRQRWPDNGPKVIAITAFAMEGDKKRCLDSGMEDYISKPVKIGELAEVLRKYLPTH